MLQRDLSACSDKTNLLSRAYMYLYFFSFHSSFSLFSFLLLLPFILGMPFSRAFFIFKMNGISCTPVIFILFLVSFLISFLMLLCCSDGIFFVAESMLDEYGMALVTVTSCDSVRNLLWLVWSGLFRREICVWSCHCFALFVLEDIVSHYS